jgi:hypothetical protein
MIHCKNKYILKLQLCFHKKRDVSKKRLKRLSEKKYSRKRSERKTAKPKGKENKRKGGTVRWTNKSRKTFFNLHRSSHKESEKLIQR